MPKKKGKKGKKKKAKKVIGPPTYMLRDNYKKACNGLGEKPDQNLLSELEEFMSTGLPYLQLCIGDNPELGPAGVRCIMEALCGALFRMEGGPYLQLTNLQLWNCGVLDAGATAVANMMKEITVKDFQLGMLDLSQNDIGVRGMAVIGSALAVGGNTSLRCLKLDFNAPHDDDKTMCEGVGKLCEGLRTNTTLKKLCMEYCNIGPLGGRYFAQLLSFSGSALEQLCLQGNSIRAAGLKVIGTVLKRNQKLQVLDVADNDIGEFPVTDADISALQTLAVSLAGNKILHTLNMDMNNITDECFRSINPLLKKNTALTHLLVDPKLPKVIFSAIMRNGAAKKGKKRKGRKKKKKK